MAHATDMVNLNERGTRMEGKSKHGLWARWFGLAAVASLVVASCASNSDGQDGASGATSTGGQKSGGAGSGSASGAGPTTGGKSGMSGGPSSSTGGSAGAAGEGAKGGVAGSSGGSGAGANPTTGGSGGSGAGTSGGGGAGAGQAGSAGMSSSEVSFKQDVMPIFQSSCLGNGCHGSDAYAADPKSDCRGWLSLADKKQGMYCPDDCVPPACEDKCGNPSVPNPTGCPDRTLHQRLLELAAWNCDDNTHRYVVPGDPDNSYVFQKITGKNVCEKSPGVPSDQMPLGAPLEDSKITTIRTWILQGAKDN